MVELEPNSGVISPPQHKILPTIFLLLLVVALLVSAFVYKPPVGVYIALAGLAAFVFAVQPDPALREKVAWIALLTALTFAEISNIYVADAKQLQDFFTISARLDGISNKLTRLISLQDQLTENLRQRSSVKNDPALLRKLEGEASTLLQQIDALTKQSPKPAAPAPTNQTTQPSAPTPTGEPVITSVPAIFHDGEILGNNFGDPGDIRIHIRVKQSAQKGIYSFDVQHGSPDRLMSDSDLANEIRLQPSQISSWTSFGNSRSHLEQCFLPSFVSRCGDILSF
jgi:hypothetical protein